MNHPTPLLSIVIPTKNRYEYLKVLIDKLLSYETQDFEVVVNDNSEDNSLFVDYVNSIQDERFKYKHVSKWLSVVENCDMAISLSSGKYVCMLGDDDGILISKAIELLRLMEKKGYEAAVLTQMSYSWPDSSHVLWKNVSGKFVIHKFTNVVHEQDTQAELNKVLRQGAGFGLGNIPRVYHAIVKKSVLDEMKKETGTYFPGPSPDMANAVGLTKYIKRHIYLDFPVIISGHSKKSTGGQGALKQHHGKVEDQAFLPKETASKWNKIVPYFWSVPTIYAESARRALVETNRADDINYSALHAMCLLYEKSYYKEVVAAYRLKNKGISRLVNLIPIAFYFTIFFTKRVVTFIKNYVNNRLVVADQISKKDIAEVITYADELYKDVHVLQKNE
jgi:glycosyltransferase involved in cell wall biosynthesis